MKRNAHRPDLRYDFWAGISGHVNACHSHDMYLFSYLLLYKQKCIDVDSLIQKMHINKKRNRGCDETKTSYQTKHRYALFSIFVYALPEWSCSNHSFFT